MGHGLMRLSSIIRASFRIRVGIDEYWGLCMWRGWVIGLACRHRRRLSEYGFGGFSLGCTRSDAARDW